MIIEGKILNLHREQADRTSVCLFFYYPLKL
nr:MAG TPA: hypothetical protein [Caudoviricetes sp.]